MIAFNADSTAFAPVVDENGGGGGGYSVPAFRSGSTATPAPAQPLDVTAVAPAPFHVPIAGPTDVSAGGAPLVTWATNPVTAGDPTAADGLPQHIIPDVGTPPVSNAPGAVSGTTGGSTTVGGGVVAPQDPATSGGSLDLALTDRLMSLFGTAFGGATTPASTAAAQPLVVQSSTPGAAAAPAASTGLRWGRLALVAVVVVLAIVGVRYYRAHHGHGGAAHV